MVAELGACWTVGAAVTWDAARSPAEASHLVFLISWLSGFISRHKFIYTAIGGLPAVAHAFQ